MINQSGSSRTGKHSYSYTLIQIVLWALLLFLPLSVLRLSGEEIFGRYLLVLGLQTLTWMALFYLNYLLLVPRMLFRRRTTMFVWCNIVISLVLPVLTQLLYSMFTGTRLQDFSLTDIVGYSSVMLMFLFLILTAVSIRSMQRNRQLEAERERNERELVSMELERLKSQLNPHFLFNSLNNISALSAIDTEATQEAISSLSDMLRYVLYDTAQEKVPLAGELRFMADYIALMRMRYTDRLKVDMRVEGECDNLMVSPMLFQSLIENAFKYGGSSKSESVISILLKRDGGTLVFRIDNTVPDNSAAQSSAVGPGHHGVGLVNLRRRLQLLYPGQHTFAAGPSSAGYTAEVTLSLNE